MKNTVPVLTLLAVLTAAAAPASAQLTALPGASKIVLTPGIVIGTDIAYHPGKNAYLTVSAYGLVWGAFVDAAGDRIGGEFRIGAADGSDAAYAAYPNVLYSPHLGGGNGGFLVVWLQSGYVYSAIVEYPGTVTAVNLVSTPAQGGAYATIRPAIAYSHTSRRFLVAWSTNAWGILARFVDTNGAPTGDVVSLVDAGEARDPGLGWNPATNEFGLSYATHSAAMIFRRVRASDGAVLSSVPIGYGHYGGNVVEVNGASQFVAGWNRDTAAGGGVYGAVIDQTGSVLASDRLLSSRMGTAFALGLAYNPVSGTLLAVSQDNGGTNDAVGVELNSDGTPKGLAIGLTSGAANGSFLPQVAASTTAKQFNIVFSLDNAAMADQIVTTGSTSTSTTTTPPPPPPPPPPTTPTVTTPMTDPSVDDLSAGGAMNLLWQHTTGAITSWRLSGATLASGVAITPSSVDPSWKIVAAGDFNMDGKRDIVFQRDDGYVAVWLMNGSALLEARLLTPGKLGDPDWRIVGAGDVNGDGSYDLFFRHRTGGWVAGWIMNGTVMQTALLLSPQRVVDNDWKIVAVGDLNADNKPDLVWQHDTSGVVTSWLMNGLTMVSAGLFSQNLLADPKWKIKAIGDVNGDGMPDMVWQHATYNWLAATILNGTTIVDSLMLTPSEVNTGWTIVGPK